MVGCALLALMVQRRREPLHALVLAAALILVLRAGRVTRYRFPALLCRRDIYLCRQ